MAGGDQEILEGKDLYLYATETQINTGDIIKFTIEPKAIQEDTISIYINNTLVYNIQYDGLDTSYFHIFDEPGEFSVYAEAVYNNIQSQPIVITVEEANIASPTSQVSWEINNKNVQSIEINNKEVKSIVTSNEEVLYNKGESNLLVLWAPQLNGETGANYVHSYSESNGEAIGKGFIFKNGFDNINSWELSFEFKHDNVRYTGICFLTDLASGYNGGGGDSSVALTTWEGSWPNGSAYATYQSGAVGYFDVTVTKIDSTHVRLQSSILNRDTTVEIPWLASATKLSFGARHNTSNGYGPCRIRNILVKGIVKTGVDDDNNDDNGGELEEAQIEPNP